MPRQGLFLVDPRFTTFRDGSRSRLRGFTLLPYPRAARHMKHAQGSLLVLTPYRRFAPHMHRAQGCALVLTPYQRCTTYMGHAQGCGSAVGTEVSSHSNRAHCHPRASSLASRRAPKYLVALWRADIAQW